MSQITEIPFIGVHNTTTENLNENGEVAMSFGLTSNDVAATTTMPAVTHLYHIDGCRILLIHNGSGFKNVFVARPSYDDNGEVKKWTTEAYTYEALNNPEETPAIMCSEPGLPNSTAVLGNVVVLNYDDRCRYAFRKNDTYLIRDNTLPPIVFEARAAVRFLTVPDDGIDTNSSHICVFNPNESIGRAGIYRYTIHPNLNEKSAREQMEFVHSKFVQIVNGWGKYGYVFSPIFVRLAYRLKTGEVVCHTNPVLCMKDFGDFGAHEPEMIWGDILKGNYTYIYNQLVALGFTDSDMMYVLGIGYTPFIRIKDCAGEEYKDLIDCIEIYTSTPIIKKSVNETDICMIYGDAGGISLTNKITMNGLIFGACENQSTEDNLPLKFFAHYKTDKLCDEDFSSVSNFYFARNINFDNIETMNEDNNKDDIFSREELNGFIRVFIDKKNNPINATADSICTRNVMSNPLNPNARFVPSNVFTFNKRIGISGLYYNTLDFTSDSSYFDSYCFVGDNHIYIEIPDKIESYYRAFICYEDLGHFEETDYGKVYVSEIIKLDRSSFSNYGEVIKSPIYEAADRSTGKTYYIRSKSDNVYYNGFLSVEDINVTTAYSLENHDNSLTLKEIKFKRHDTLNISISVGGVKKRTLDFSKKEDWELFMLLNDVYNGANCFRHYNDYIRLSNVGDPYSFDASNTAYFNSPVERVMIVPEAITLGQYGTDQIYVICQDGVYTVGLNDEGKLTRVNTFTSDKIDANRACIAGGQLFVNNGISWDFYQGQNRNQFLSMKRNTAFHFDNLPHILSLNETKQWEWCLQGDNLFDFMQRCTLYYDSINAQIIGVVPNTGFYLVWSKDDGFRMVKSNAEYRVQYNTLLLADNDSNLYDFEATDAVHTAEGLVIMRPFHLNAEQKNGRSTVRSVIVRGNFDDTNHKSAVQLILYGSMDCKTWHVVASSTRYYITGISGTPYTAFRLVVFAKLQRDEYLSHITVEYENRETQRLHF